MTRSPQRPLGVLGAIGLVAAVFAGAYAPRRARRLSAQYAKFRTDFQPTYDAIDAQYHHYERTVNGIRWHYVEEGSTDGEAILFLHGSGAPGLPPPSCATPDASSTGSTAPA